MTYLEESGATWAMAEESDCRHRFDQRTAHTNWHSVKVQHPWRNDMRTALAVAATVITAAALMTGCGNDNGPRPSATASPTAAQPVPVTVTIETGSGLVGVNHDDEVCVFAELEYELRDGAGTIIDVGQWEDSGASIGDSTWAAIGRVESLDPYRCALSETISAPAADFYTLTVTVTGGAIAGSESSEVTFARDDAGSVGVELGE